MLVNCVLFGCFQTESGSSMGKDAKVKWYDSVVGYSLSFKYSHSNNNFMATFTFIALAEVKSQNNILVVIY